MGEDGAKDRQLGAKMGPTWPIWNRKCTLWHTFWNILVTFWGSWARKAHISKISFPPRREHDFQGLRASWEAYLGPSWRYVGTSYRYVGLSWAILALSWTILALSCAILALSWSTLPPSCDNLATRCGPRALRQAKQTEKMDFGRILGSR